MSTIQNPKSKIQNPVDLVALERLVKIRLRPWATSIDYDDLAQECRIAGWRAAARYEGPARPSTIMIKAIDWERSNFFRSAMARHGRINKRGVQDPVPVPFHELDMEEDGKRAPTAADFAPALIEQLYGAWLWARRADWLTAAEAAVIAAVVLNEEPSTGYAARSRTAPSTVFYLRQRALNRYRRRLGLPAK